MSTPQRQMHIGIALEDSGVQSVAWRLPSSSETVPSIQHFVKMAQTAERACLDFVFCADLQGLHGDKEYIRLNQPMREYDPIVLQTALAMITEKIGLVSTVSTTFSRPFKAARQLASLDHISGGRAAWNIVTSWLGHDNYGLGEMQDHATRYAVAEEHVDVVTKLWDSWEDDVKIFDRESGVYADPDKIHTIDFHGEHFDVRGPLNISRPPQGRPVLVQAGSSEWGRDFGAKWAEVVFTSQHDLASAQEFYADFKRRVAAAGRDPQKVAILPGISPFVGATEEEAREKWMTLNDMLDPARRMQLVERALHLDLTGASLKDLDLDDVVPVEFLPAIADVEGHQSRYEIYYNWVVNDKRTIRQLAAEASSSAGHWLLMGTPEQIADQMIERFENGAADGFNVVPAALPSTLDDFAEHVIPILQERGYFRTEYTGSTLRDHLGLDRPVSQYAQ